jgi:virginiamycin B lyase
MKRHSIATRLIARITSFSIAAGIVLAGCGQSAMTNVVPSQSAPAPQQLRASAPATVPHHGKNDAKVTFRVKWKKPTQRRAHYLPATARSLSVTIDGGTPQYMNAPITSIAFDAPVGLDTFIIESYDEQNGQGNVLSRAAVTQSIVQGQPNVLAVTLNGVVASLQLSLSEPSPDAGKPATATIIVSALDPDGNRIVGKGDYSVPIKLAIADYTNSGTLKLSNALLQNPADTAKLIYNGETLNSGLAGGPAAYVIASATGVGEVSAAFTPVPTFYQYSIPAAADRPQWIALGHDGNMWFTEYPGNAVARITRAGVVTAFTVPTTNALPEQIIGASDGNLWFTEYEANKIAKVTTAGAFTEYSTLFAPPPNDNPIGLVDRLDGNIWYVANTSSRVGSQGISSGAAAETSIPTSNSGPFGIATAPDNNLYYTESNVDKIGRITNVFTAQSELSLTAGSVPEQIVRGPDGNVWFTENGRNNIGRVSPSCFCVTGEFPTLTPSAAPVGITAGADGALWFTERGLDRIGRVTTGGTVSEFSSPVTGLGLQGIAVARDGSLWFTEPGTGLSPGRIGRLVY